MATLTGRLGQDGWVTKAAQGRAGALGRWWGRKGLQYRSTFVSVVAVAIALVFIGVGGLLLLRIGLESAARNAAIVRAEDFSAEFATDADGARAEVDAEANDGMLIQVFDATGRVVAASSALDGRAPLTAMATDKGKPDVTTVQTDMPDRAPYLVASTLTTSTGGPLTVAAAQSLAERDRVVRIAAYALVLMVPFLLIAVGIATWLSVGRSLSTVDDIRARVERIEGGNLDQRVPVPTARDAIRNLATTMNQMLDRLQSSLSAQRRFVADASHELKSPLAAMRTTIDVGMMTDGVIDREGADVLTDEVQRMSRLVADLLLLAKSDEGVGAGERTDVDLDDLVAIEARRVRQHSDLTVETSLEAVRVHGDPMQLDRLLRNLTENAQRFAHSTIRLTVQRSDGARVAVIVEDDGPGVPADKREAVFDRFVRLDEHRSREQGGTGLGLAIVREIARSHGGSAVVEASELGGARVVVTLPMDEEVVA